VRLPSAADLLDTWEQGQVASPTQRALLLLANASPELPPEALQLLTIGQRDAYLLALREHIFGSRITGLATCPKCAARLELALSTDDILIEQGPTELVSDRSLSLSIEEYELRFRLPNSQDLLALEGQDDGQALNSGRRLLDRCLVKANMGECEVVAGDLPPEVVEAIASQMAAADPQADVQVLLTCPACSQQWQEIFDIVTFFWSELNSWAERTLREVHALALAYGWGEADTLALSQWRRQVYLEMIDG
jgi:hypothetical protein